ncbi:MAG: hypothetical protein D6815_05380 [Candidatus Dadabacteria bacterium]|nr:MAG: hypothetical protein D6815_05380 [Candidatus Dadabacteria bacterium]
MNVLDLEEMLAGIVQTLDEQVGPHVTDGQARAQLYSSLDLLNNLSSKLDWKRELLTAEIDSIVGALGEVTAALDGVGEGALGESLEQAKDLIQEREGTDDLTAFCRRANEVLDGLIAALYDSGIEGDAADRARAAIHQHLINQTIRDSMFLKPMMLKKISQG